MALNLARLRGSVTKNKAALGLLGAAAVAALAWRARTSATSSTSTGATAAGTTLPTGTSATPSYYTSGGSSYDSTASDVYNAIQPQLESVGSAVASLTELFKTIPVPGTPAAPAEAPTPAAPASIAPTLQGVYARTGTQALYAAMSDGTRTYLDSAGWDSLGQPAPTYLGADNPLWSRTLTNADAPLSHRTPA